MLFGHQNDDNKPAGQGDSSAAPLNATAPSVPPITGDPSADLNLPAVPDDLVSEDGATTPDQSQLQAPITFPPSAPIEPSHELVATNPEPVVEPETPAETPAEPSEPSSDTGSAVPAVVSQDLLALKQRALQQLEPLVDHLEQSPEEKFRTTMMLIQSTDNQTLLTSAYEIAQSIPDDKIRAQALLDVVNEINYFTQHPQAA